MPLSKNGGVCVCACTRVSVSPYAETYTEMQMHRCRPEVCLRVWTQEACCLRRHGPLGRNRGYLSCEENRWLEFLNTLVWEKAKEDPKSVFARHVNI